ncbi:MAG: substrate-binding domain-containing protein [Thiobacillus sp.]|nr:substrate-binding domain-containing protein [Thiobacillus sp.]
MNELGNSGRRNFLLISKSLVAAWMLGRIPVSRGDDDRQLESIMRIQGQICRTRLASEDALPRKLAGDLFYQGTHILTHGAFRDLAAAYSQPGRRMVAAGGGCDDGIGAVRTGVADLGGMCCPVRGSRAEGMPYRLVAHDYKAVIAHPDSRVTQVSLAQLRKIARGEIARWSVLGGPDRAIALVARKHCPDYFEPVRHLLLDNRPTWSARGIYVDTDEQITDTVSRYPAALGLVSWVFVKPLAESGRLRVLAVDGRHPGQGRDYPLLGPLSVVYARWNDTSMRPFFDYLYGPTGQRILGRLLLPVSAREAGYAPSAVA